MKIVTIQPVEKPKDFKSVRFSLKDWEEANRAGPKRVPFVTAEEAIRRSGGLYEIKSEVKQEVEVKLTGLKDPDEMTAAELVNEMTLHGKPPRKRMSRGVAVKFVRDLREKAAAMITEDPIEPADEEEDGEDQE